MSTTSTDLSRWSAELTDFPDFDLKFLFDEPENPTEVTILSPGNDDDTIHWIAIDVDAAVPIEAMH